MDTQVSIGETLRRRREERGLTTEQAAFQSKVPVRLVQVLESDDYHLTPDPLYLVRLLHEYGAFLGLDVAQLDADFQQVIQRPPRTSLAVAPAASPAVAIPWKQALWTVAAILVLVPVVIIALSLASKRADERVEQTPAAAPQPERAAAADSAVAVAPDRTAEIPGPAVETPAAPIADTRDILRGIGDRVAEPSASVRHVLVARALEPTWMSVWVDRKDVREVLLQAGQVARFEAANDFQVTVGNAGGVTLTLNGAPLPPLGRSGEVIRDLVLPPARQESPSSDATAAAPAR